MPHAPARRPSAFTLVELLVVIGIIAVLIGLLLPSLAGARRAAQQVACAAKLHAIMLAAQTHRNTHRDYYPLAGIIPGVTPEILNDIDTAKYDYFSYNLSGTTRLLCPLTDSLYTQMASSWTNNSTTGGLLGSTDEGQREKIMLDPNGPLKPFICPAQANSPLDIQPQFVAQYVPLTPTNYVLEPQSYVYNEYVLGWQDNLGHLRGKGSLVRTPAVTMFAADGLGGSTLANHGGVGIAKPLYTVYNMTVDYPRLPRRRPGQPARVRRRQAMLRPQTAPQAAQRRLLRRPRREPRPHRRRPVHRLDQAALIRSPRRPLPWAWPTPPR